MKLLLPKLLVCLLFSASCTVAHAQECDDLIQNKIEQYFLNIRPKPDSLAEINCNFIKQRLGVNDVFLDFLSTTLNNEAIFFLTIVKKNAPSKVTVIPQVNSTIQIKDTSATRSSIKGSLKKDGYEKYDQFLTYFYQDIKDAGTIYYSTSGDLNLVNLKHLKNPGNIPLFRDHHMVRLHTAASFLQGRQQLRLSAKMNVLLAGNISYNCDTTAAKNQTFGSTWNYLPGTKAEINEIARILKSNHVTRIIDSCNVTEAQLIKEINENRFDIVHVATHGFYIENEDETLGAKKSSFPLDKSGIVLTGANNKNASIAAFNPFGLFTASDFLKVKLGNARLVVLSTCHSGEGSSTQSGAPIGLILSLLRQETTAMIVSNRAVDDNLARAFMTSFYTNLAMNTNADECFTKTLRDLNKKNPNVAYDFFDLIH